MKGHRIHFFATKTDLAGFLRVIESKRDLQFTQAGLSSASILDCQTSLLAAVALGISNSGNSIQEPRYLIAARDYPVNIRAVPQRAGGILYAVDQLLNPESIIFQPGGVFEKTCVISGEAGTVSDHAASLALFKLFQEEIKRQFSRIQSFWVGDEAGRLLNQGYRLTGSVTMAPLHDLKRS